MKVIYPKDYWKKKYEEKTEMQKYVHGAKFAWRNKVFIKWHFNMLKLWYTIKINKNIL